MSTRELVQQGGGEPGTYPVVLDPASETIPIIRPDKRRSPAEATQTVGDIKRTQVAGEALSPDLQPKRQTANIAKVTLTEGIPNITTLSENFSRSYLTLNELLTDQENGGEYKAEALLFAAQKVHEEIDLMLGTRGRFSYGELKDDVQLAEVADEIDKLTERLFARMGHHQSLSAFLYTYGQRLQHIEKYLERCIQLERAEAGQLEMNIHGPIEVRNGEAQFVVSLEGKGLDFLPFVLTVGSKVYGGVLPFEEKITLQDIEEPTNIVLESTVGNEKTSYTTLRIRKVVKLISAAALAEKKQKHFATDPIKIANLLLRLQENLQPVDAEKVVHEKGYRKQRMLTHLSAHLLKKQIISKPEKYGAAWWQMTDMLVHKKLAEMKKEAETHAIYEEAETFIQDLTERGELSSINLVESIQLYIMLAVLDLISTERLIEAGRKNKLPWPTNSK